jgi:hypothetical protein
MDRAGVILFIETINRHGDEFKYLKKFPRVSDSKIRDGIFVGSQIWKLLKVANFNTKFSKAERRVGMAFESVLWNFLEDKKTITDTRSSFFVSSSWMR